ncbi:MAG: 50S ribosomal protein L30e [Thermoplasmata archaeon]|nr:MAG: 50S ribosomal protein L30e [Thermoplasmata archaeon]RLF64997.1 MAG: 50S ribosomal protein L30e [Thermoplasmata archaeon]
MNKMDMAKELGRVLSTGKVYIGFKEAMKRDDAKMFIVSSDCPRKKEVMELAGDKPVFVYGGKSMELGNLCKKPFSISVMAIVDEGSSNIMELGK